MASPLYQMSRMPRPYHLAGCGGVLRSEDGCYRAGHKIVRYPAAEFDRRMSLTANRFALSGDIRYCPTSELERASPSYGVAAERASSCCPSAASIGLMSKPIFSASVR